MSRINGDKARYHRDRKDKIARRKRQKELFKKVTETPAKSSGKA